MGKDRPKLFDLVDMGSPSAIFEEVKAIVRSADPNFPFATIDRIHADIVRLFAGRYAGYRACNTAFHDLSHTLFVLLAMARLIDGSMAEGVRWPDREIDLALVSALMHDTGYIQASDDTEGTGAKYTMIHIGRSADFVRSYFSADPAWSGEADAFHGILHCTGVSTRIDEIVFASPRDRRVGWMLGTADLLGQMADRCYLEKLALLYREFQEGDVAGFAGEFDLIEKTRLFYDFTQERCRREFGGVDRWMVSHFRRRWGIARDLYADAIESNIRHLERILANHRHDYGRVLRRNCSPSGDPVTGGAVRSGGE